MVAQLATEAQEPINNKRAGICGQLLAILEELQYLLCPGGQSQTECNAGRPLFRSGVFRAGNGIWNPAYGCASASDETTQEPFWNLRCASGSTGNLLASLDDFPTTLTLRQQALFSLGYYKRRAEIRRGKTAGAMLKRAKNEQAAEASALDTDTTEEEEN